jgi:hypothetical protein
VRHALCLMLDCRATDQSRSPGRSDRAGLYTRNVENSTY